jgi:hypothetical protein
MFTFVAMHGHDNAKPAAWQRQPGLTKHAGLKFLTNPDASGEIGNNWEGELAIGNYRELSGIIGTRFLPIFPEWSGM